MSRIITKSVAIMAAATLALLSLFALPAAAQTSYAPPIGGGALVHINPLATNDPIACGGQPFGSISGGVGPYTVSYTLNGASIGSFVVAGQGAYVAPAGTVDYATLVDGTYVIGYTVTDVLGAKTSGSYSALLTDNCDGGADPTPGGGAGTANPIVAVPVPAQQLAFTGNEVSLPVTAGAILIGAGGLMLLAANKRSRKDI